MQWVADLIIPGYCTGTLGNYALLKTGLLVSLKTCLLVSRGHQPVKGGEGKLYKIWRSVKHFSCISSLEGQEGYHLATEDFGQYLFTIYTPLPAARSVNALDPRS